MACDISGKQKAGGLMSLAAQAEAEACFLARPVSWPKCLTDVQSDGTFVFNLGETDMGDKGSKDKGQREQQKKAQLTQKEKRKLKKEKKKKK